VFCTGDVGQASSDVEKTNMSSDKEVCKYMLGYMFLGCVHGYEIKIIYFPSAPSFHGFIEKYSF
jgi:hypothetical protein